MKSYTMSKRSLDNLRGVHPYLVYIARRALFLSEVDFVVTEGVRDIERQRYLLAQGDSWTLKSKHLLQDDDFGHAIDVAAWVDGDVSWEFEDYEKIAESFQLAAADIGVDITWGGEWKSKDGPHFEIHL